MGLAVAKLCAKHGMKVAIADRNDHTLSLAKKSLSGSDVETYNMDVSELSQMQSLREKVQQRFGGVDFLMLNAGMAERGKSWEDHGYFQRVMATNLFGVINGINVFLPAVQQRASEKRPTSIVITGSKQGITNPPGNAAYNASKAAVVSLAQQLSYDLRDATTTVHLLVPGWAFTGLSGNEPGKEAEKPAGAWWPEQVADYMHQKMGEEDKSGKGKFYIICPDNDVTWDKDRRRMMWTMGDIVYERQPLSRWREEYKEEAEKGMADMKL